MALALGGVGLLLMVGVGMALSSAVEDAIDTAEDRFAALDLDALDLDQLDLDVQDVVPLDEFLERARAQI